jgi:CxxC motif-containing protein (DUF1111 family)
MSPKNLQHYCKKTRSNGLAAWAALFVLSATIMSAQFVRRVPGAVPASSPLKPISSSVTDPGPRGGPPGAGGTFTLLDNTNSAANQSDHDFFAETLLRFQEVDSVSGTIESGSGLGPNFNLNSCAGCHAQPAIGGSSPATNPQLANNFPHLDGATNPADLSQVISATGPVREVRFIYNTNYSLDGGVKNLFTIAGRTDAPGCNLAQPNFDAALADYNAIFRIPIALFGDGLVELTSDEALEASFNATASQRAQLGIAGAFNYSGNDGTITRFGWKAQNKSLLMFAGEAYNVEQGVSNELFENERFLPGTNSTIAANCTFNGTPEDSTNIINPQASTIVGGVTKPNPNLNTPVGTASEMSSDVVNFAAFMRLLAPPTPVTSTASQLNGQSLFTQIGCSLCHTTTLTTDKGNGSGINGGANGPFPALQGFTYHPLSDFALHQMGSTLADGISQGQAGPDQFRTAPLWGLGQRLFLLHDGRTTNLITAILDHADFYNDCMQTAFQEIFEIEPIAVEYSLGSLPPEFCGSEANQVIENFTNTLSSSQQQDLLNYLRSL